ncbi:MAG TPA: type II toxin-antitoxin system HicB family antitoxin [Ktedonobacterales bacterium]|nr:type II toxin-antitoxin system HicB family antitoxin [Ktedonobacterales bacterium]
MDGATTYDAYLEGAANGSWRARLLDLAGCWGDGATEQQALAAVSAAIPAYFAWLRAHDEYTPVVGGPFEVRPRESQPARAEQSQDIGAFFAPDAFPATDDELEWELALLGWAYDDLLAVAPRVRGEAAAERALDDALRTQAWLLAACDPALAAGLDAGGSGDQVAAIATVARTVLQRLRAATPAQRVTVHASGGEQWSLRKTLRRSIELVRETTQTIARLA